MRSRILIRLVRDLYGVTVDAFWLFLADDGWAIASHIALSALMAFFPFIIVLTALAGVFGSETLADTAAEILLAAWPKEVAGPIADEISRVLTGGHGGVLTIGVALAVYFSSSGVESLRIGLNRAYDIQESRSWWLLRLESIAYVVVGAVGLITLSFFVILGPLLVQTIFLYVPRLAPFAQIVTFARLAAATVVLVTTLVVVHLWLPAGRRRLREIAPGVIATLLLWLAAGTLFGRYLTKFANAYTTYYAGLASAMIALVFLYYSASIFIYGGELNTALRRRRDLGTPPSLIQSSDSIG
jgi:membrane protein